MIGAHSTEARARGRALRRDVKLCGKVTEGERRPGDRLRPLVEAEGAFYIISHGPMTRPPAREGIF